MKRWIHSATTVDTYRNKKNPNKYVEVHKDGYGHRSAKQYMQWDETGVTNPTGDGNLHRWRKDNMDELLEDYEEVESSIDISAAEIVPNKKIQKGMVWHSDGFTHEVQSISRDGKTCKVTEDWINEDTGKPMHKVHKCTIEDDNGQEYIYEEKYKEYANPGHNNDGDYSWWARMYATGADNYPYMLYDEDGFLEPDEDEEDDEEYTPSASRHDYSPSNPWDAPGMSMSDFF